MKRLIQFSKLLFAFLVLSVASKVLNADIFGNNKSPFSILNDVQNADPITFVNADYSSRSSGGCDDKGCAAGCGCGCDPADGTQGFCCETGCGCGCSSGGGGGGGGGGDAGCGGGGGGGCGDCFVAETPVIMADGSRKNIESVRVGDKVIGTNGTINTVVDLTTVTLRDRKLYAINDTTYFVTAAHPFMTEGGIWKSVDPAATKIEGRSQMDVAQLAIGDVLVTREGTVTVNRLTNVSGDQNTSLYDLHLDGDHTYFAHEFLVHNK